MAIKIKDILNSGQFNVCGPVKIISYRWTEEGGEEFTEKWGSEFGNCDLPDADLMEHEVTSLYITSTGCLEIEYNADEFMGYGYYDYETEVETDEENHG